MLQYPHLALWKEKKVEEKVEETPAEEEGGDEACGSSLNAWG